MNLGAGPAVAVRELQLPAGPCDYLPFLGRKAAGVVEAKPEGRTLTGMVEQAETSMQRLPDNQRLTLKQNPLRREHVDDFVACFGRDARQGREGTDRFRRFAYADLLKRDRLNLDLAWLKDDSPEDTSNLPPPGAIAAEIVENLEAALARFRQVAEALARLGAVAAPDG